MSSPGRTRRSASATNGDLFGHPRGLAFLFATEMWERFSYYGMRALLVLYMVKYLLQPERAQTVIGFAALKSALEVLFGPLDMQPLSSQIYGLYTGLVYLTPMFGGFSPTACSASAAPSSSAPSLMAIGHFMMAFEPLFLLALLVLILGNGAFKPNISTQVGALYAPGDPRRDRAFSIFYVGINLGAFLAPLVCGTLGEELGWHYGFAAAGVGMMIGLAIYLYATRAAAARRAKPGRGRRQARSRSTATNGARSARCMLLALPVTLFWATYEQQGNTIALWADGYTDRTINLGSGRGNPGHLVPGVQPVHDLRLHAVRAGAVEAAGGRGSEPSTVTKMALGCFGVAAGLPGHGRRGAAAPAAARRAGSGCSPISSSSPSASSISRRSACRSSPRSRRPASSR